MDKVEYWVLNIVHLKIQFCPKDSSEGACLSFDIYYLVLIKH